MKKILYLFVNILKTEFKIGVTNNIEDRYIRIVSVWGEIDLSASYLLIGSRHEINKLEKTLHFFLDRWRLKKPINLDGHSEWFAMECFDKAMEIIAYTATLRDFNLNYNLFIGTDALNYKKQIQDSIIKLKNDTFINLDGLKKRWHLYKARTLDFKDHPDMNDTWLWTINLDKSLVLEFMDLFVFKSRGTTMTLVPRVCFCENQPSIINADIPKISMSWLKGHEEFTQYYDFFYNEIDKLISEGHNRRK